MLKKIVDMYYQFRRYGKPNPTQALLFLISEVGELAEAYLNARIVSRGDAEVLNAMIELGRRADEHVSGQDQWVRNNDRKKAPDTSAEIGDVLMMLTSFTGSYMGSTPELCMFKKFEQKGFPGTALSGEDMMFYQSVKDDCEWAASKR